MCRDGCIESACGFHRHKQQKVKQIYKSNQHTEKRKARRRSSDAEDGSPGVLSLGVTSFPPAVHAGGCPGEEALMCLLESVTTYTGSL